MSSSFRWSNVAPVPLAVFALWLVMPPAPGVAVSDEVAASLKGGACSGAQLAKCDNDDACSNNGYISGGSGHRDSSPSGTSTTYCSKTLNGETVCNDSSTGYSSCGGG
jgi:hypothetical protein